MLINSYRFATAATDPNFANVSLLLHGDASPLIDSSGTPKAISAFGNAAYSTTQKKFGSGSIAFDGSGDYLTLQNISNQLTLSGDFTIDSFVWLNNFSSYMTIYQSQWTTGGFILWHHLSYVNKFSFWMWNYSTTVPVLVQSSTLTANTFYHVAITRAGNTLKMFVGGTLEATATTSATIEMPLPYIGAYADGSTATPFGFYLNGYVDEFRITKGISRYNATFPPPTALFPDS